MSLGFSAYSRTLSTLVFIEIFSGTERVAPFSLNSDQKRLELVWMFVQREENVVGSADFYHKFDCSSEGFIHVAEIVTGRFFQSLS